jgi:hypothetical protein
MAANLGRMFLVEEKLRPLDFSLLDLSEGILAKAKVNLCATRR